jgi:hypothetical protein
MRNGIFFHKILGEAGEVRFLSYGWRKEEANNKDSNELKDSDLASSGIYTIHELNANGYVPVSPSEAGLEEVWEPVSGTMVMTVNELPETMTFYSSVPWHRVLLKAGLLKPTREAAEAAYKRMMGE